MKILCEKCGASHELDVNRIPIGGMQFKCPACLHSFPVSRPGESAPAPEAAPAARTIFGIGPTDVGAAAASPPAAPAAPAAPAKGGATRYHVRRRTGRTFGPFLESAIISMLEQGKLDGDEDLSLDGKSWQPLADFPALARFYKAPAGSASAPALASPAAAGGQGSDDADLPAPKRSGAEAVDLLAPKGFFDDSPMTGSGSQQRPMRPTTPAGPPPMRPPERSAIAPPAPAVPAPPRFDLDDVDLLAPKDGPRRVGADIGAPSTPPTGKDDEIDLPAPKQGPSLRTPPPAIPMPAAAAPPPPPRGAPPAPRPAAPKLDLGIPSLDLPAPKVDLPTPKVDLPAPKIDLPTPKVDLPAPKIDLPAPKGPSPAAAGRADLPVPVGPAGRKDLPAPKGPSPTVAPPPMPPRPPAASRPPTGPSLPALDDLDLPMVDFSARGAPPAPAAPPPGGVAAFDLDEPSPEPGPLPSGPAPRAARPAAPTPSSFELDGLDIGAGLPVPSAAPAAAASPPSAMRLELDGLDLGAPASSSSSGDAMMRGPGGEFVGPDGGELEDMPGVIDLALPAGAAGEKKPEAAFNLDEAPPVSLADELEGKAAPSPLRKGAKGKAAPTPATAKKQRLVMLVGGGVALVALVGVGFGVFGKHLLGGSGAGRSGAGGAGDQAARAAILEDNYPTLRDAATKLLASGTPSLQQRGLAAQALLLAFVGHQGPRELVSKAREAMGTLPPKGPFPPELERGRGLLAVVEGKAAEGERLLAAAPADARDGLGQLVAAWARLHAGKAKEAEPLFQKAATAAGIGPALYGAGAAREATGDVDGAHGLYEQAATKAPLHAAAALGAARTVKDASAREAALRRFIQQKAAKASPGEKAEALGLIGEIALGGGQLDEAEKQFEEALKLDRTAARAQNGLAAVNFEGGRHEAALKRYQEIRKTAPKSVDAVLGAGRCLLELGRLMDADEPVAAAERMAPNDARVLALRGQRQELTDTPAALEGAVKSYLAALKADDKYAPGYAQLARTYLKLKRDADAVSALKQGQVMVPQSAVIDNAFGEAYLKTGDAPKAEERFRAALAKNPNLHLARFNLGAALEKAGRLDQAEKEYANLAEKAQRFPGLPERQARLYLKMGRVEQALQAFDQALRMERPPVALRLAAGEAFVENGARNPCFAPPAAASQSASAPAAAPPAPPPTPPQPCFELARTAVDSVLNEDGRNAPANNLMGRAMAGLGKPDEGLTFARRAVALDPKRAEYHLHVGEILEQLGRPDQALQELDLAVGGAPTLAGAYIVRGRILVKRRQFREALVELGKAVQRDKGNAAAYRFMGEAFSGLRQLPQAIEAYQNAVRRAPHDAEAQYKLAEAYADAERRGPAVDAFRKALQLGGDKVAWAAEAHRRLGFIHKEGGARGQATAEFKRYLELKPDAADRGEILQQLRFLE
jgi:predicted Zn finger-like uncharacterized protein